MSLEKEVLGGSTMSFKRTNSFTATFGDMKGAELVPQPLQSLMKLNPRTLA
jgi:hypothetical protein